MKKEFEKGLKRFLKRKVKITMGVIVSFMIMGNVGLASTVSYEKVENLETKINLYKVLYKDKNNGIEVIEDGDILLEEAITNEDTIAVIKDNIDLTEEENYIIGNGIGIHTLDGNININGITNSGTISSNIGNFNIQSIDENINVIYNTNIGNGIGFYTESGNITLGNIINENGSISSSINKFVINENNAGFNNNIGNGIGFYTKKGDITLENIENMSGTISSNIGDFVLNNSAQNINVENGIGIYTESGNIILENIINENKDIVSNVNNFNMDSKISNLSNKNVGNTLGFYTTSGNINLKNIENINGNVSSKIENFIISSTSTYQSLNENIGNGIGIHTESGNIALGSITNENGSISSNIGKFITNKDYKNKNIGNGIGIYTESGNITLGSITNENGSIKSNIVEITNGIVTGNGLSIFTKNEKDSITIEEITNSGVISGKVNSIKNNFDYGSDRYSGNGIVLAGDLTTKKISNNGIISGEIGNIYDENILGYGNGVINQGINGEITDGIINTGTISGKIKNINLIESTGSKTNNIDNSGNGITFDSNSSTFNNTQLTIGSIQNKGMIVGEVENIIDNTKNNFYIYDTGNGIHINKGILEIPEITNEGIISGKVVINGNVSSTNDTRKSTIENTGNGIKINSSPTKNLNIKIGNSGLISGEYSINNSIIKEVMNSGNGIDISSTDIGDDGNKTSTIKKFDNNGIIVGCVKENFLSNNVMDTGNGIKIFPKHKGGLKLEDFNNNGYILGNINQITLKGNLLNDISTHYGIGNGISFQPLKIEINKFNNTGIILGNVDTMAVYNSSVEDIGIGLRIEDDSRELTEGIKVNNFKNNGVISGSVENFTSDVDENIITNNTNLINGLGVGMTISGRDIHLGNLDNNGIINNGVISGSVGNISRDDKDFLIDEMSYYGNGLVLSNNVSSSTENMMNLKINLINNNGVITGYYKDNTGDKHAGKKAVGNGIAIIADYILNDHNGQKYEYEYEMKEFKNLGVVAGKENGLYIYQSDYDKFNSKDKFTNNYSNYGLMIGQTPVKFENATTENIINMEDGNDRNWVADKGYAIVLNEDGTVKEVVGTETKEENSNKYSLDIFGNGENAEYTILNTTKQDIKDDKYTNAWQEFGNENLENHIINGVGEKFGVVTVASGKEFTLNNGIINAYKTAITIGDNSTFTGTNVIINGGGLRGSDKETDIIKGTDLTNNLNLAGNVQINGSIDLIGNNDDDSLNFGTSNIDEVNSTKVNIYDEIKSAETINLKNNSDVTLYETAKITGTDKINIESGSQLTLRIDSSVKDENGNYKTHALYNDSDETLTITGDISNVNKGESIVEEGKDRYDNLSVLNVETNGLGVNSTIELGNVDFANNNNVVGESEEYTQNNTTVWVKTNSILHGAKVYEDEVGNGKFDTKIKIEGKKDLFSIINGIDSKPLEPSTKYEGNILNIETIPGVEVVFNGLNGIAGKYNNAGTIIGNSKNKGLLSKSGNGMIYSTTENNLVVKRLENTGNILGYAEVNSSADSEILNKNSGNGISILLDIGSKFEDKNDRTLTLEEGIVNSGVITGKTVNNAVNGKNVNSGNGINISSELENGEVSNIKIAVADENNENIVGIENSGFILGELTGKDKTVNEYSGNGMAMTFKGAEGSIEIGNIENTGVIKAYHSAGVTDLNSIGSNNGIIISDSSEGTLTMGNITNKGLINVERTINPELKPKVNINENNHIVSKSYNGIVIENANVGNEVDFGTIKNNGSILVSGHSKVSIQDEFSLNGIYVGTTGAINGTIENNGKIASGWGNSASGSEKSGNGILIDSTTTNEGSIINLTNTGLIAGKENAVAISQNSKMTFNYNNYGVIAGKNLISANEYDDNKSAGYGLGIKLDENGVIDSIIIDKDKQNQDQKHKLQIFQSDKENDKETLYSVINTELRNKVNDKFTEAYNIYEEDTNLSNVIINGAGNESGTVTVANNKEFSLQNGVINAYKTALTLEDNSTFTGNNVIFNGGVLAGSDEETDVIKGNTDVNLNLSGEIQINGSIDLDSNGNTYDNDSIKFGTEDIRTEAGIFDTIKGADKIEIGSNTDITFYETSELKGTKEINIAKGGELSLRVDANETKEINGKTYIVGHALYNNGETIVIKGNGATDGVKEQDKDLIDDIINNDGNLSNVTDSKEEHGKNEYKDSSVFDIVTNGLGRDSLISLGNVAFEDMNKIWIKTNSILTKAEVENPNLIQTLEYTDEDGERTNPGTVIKVTGEQDIFEMGDNPDKPINKNEKLYVKLNEIYKGIYSSGDRNFNALNDIVTNFTFGDEHKGDYPIIGNEQMQMATLLGYLRSVYEETPYSFSNEATRKSMDLFHDAVRDNQFKALKDEWIIFGGLTHENGDQEQTYYGRNYHGFDTGSANTDVNIKTTGTYGQFEYGFTDTLSGGILVGGNNNSVEVASSKLDGTSAYAGVYAKKDIKDLRITTGIGYQYSEYDSTRRTINNSYEKDYSDNALNIYLDAKYSYKLSDGLYFEPKAGLSYSYIKQESIDEGGKELALDVDSKDFNYLEGSVGADIKKVIMSDKGKHTLSGGVTYTRILDGYEEDALTANYGGSSFDILVPHKMKDEISIGAKYETELENGILYNVKANYNVNMDSKENGNKNATDGEWRVGIGFGYRFSSVKDIAISASSLFDFGKSEVKPEGKQLIKTASEKLNNKKVKGTLSIEGHTDWTGTREYNQKLSEKRADAVTEEFKKNVTNENIKYETKGYGEDRPIADNKTKEGRAKNRRVEVRYSK